MLPEYVSAFVMKHLRPVFSQWFDFVPYDANKTYSKDCVFVTHHDKDQGLAEQLWQQGFKVAVEELWEYPDYIHITIQSIVQNGFGSTKPFGTCLGDMNVITQPETLLN